MAIQAEEKVEKKKRRPRRPVSEGQFEDVLCAAEAEVFGQKVELQRMITQEIIDAAKIQKLWNEIELLTKKYKEHVCLSIDREYDAMCGEMMFDSINYMSEALHYEDNGKLIYEWENLFKEAVNQNKEKLNNGEAWQTQNQKVYDIIKEYIQGNDRKIIRDMVTQVRERSGICEVRRYLLEKANLMEKLVTVYSEGMTAMKMRVMNDIIMMNNRQGRSKKQGEDGDTEE